jgi:hemoglobin
MRGMTNPDTPKDNSQENSVSLYGLVGGDEKLRELVDRFYDLMDLEPEFAALRAMHPP